MNFKHILYTLGLALTAYLSWHFGLWLAPPQEMSSPSTSTFSSSLTPSSTSLPTQRPTPAIAFTTATTPVGTHNSEQLPSSTTQTEKYQKLSRFFSNTPEGRALYTTAKWSSLAAAVNTEEAQAVAEQMALLKANPRIAFIELKNSLPQLGSDLAHERQSLVQLAAQLDIDPKEKLQFLGEELTQSTRPLKANDLASFNGLTALELMMQQTDQSDSLLPFLKTALTQQTDLPTRTKLISTFEKKFPSQAQQLRTEFLK